MTTSIFSGDRNYTAIVYTRRRRNEFLNKNKYWGGVPISWTGSFKDGKYYVHADAGVTPWRHQGTCEIEPGYHLVDACDAIIDSWLDREPWLDDDPEEY